MTSAGLGSSRQQKFNLVGKLIQNAWPPLWKAGSLIGVLIIVLMFGSGADLRPSAWWRSAFPAAGLIYVHSPQVYTRERLINERLAEGVWLDGQLEKADDDDSLIGVVRRINRSTSLRRGKENAQTSLPVSAKLATDDPDDVLTFDQKVRLKSANRDFILQKVIENRLDDRHDLQGNALYILKFDTTVVANELSGRKAVISITMQPPIEGIYDTSLDDASYSYLFNAESLQVMRSAFSKLTGSMNERLNQAVSARFAQQEASSEVELDRELWNSAVIEAASREFGIVKEQITIHKIIIPDAAIPDAAIPDAAIPEPIKLVVTSLRDYVDFHANYEDAGVPPTFQPYEGQTYFLLLEGDEVVCSSVEKTSVEKSGYFERSVDYASDQNVRLFTLADIDSIPVSHLYKLMLALIAADEYKIGQTGSYFFDWGYVTRELNKQENGECQVSRGSLNTGLVQFIKRVAEHSTYSYSVLPRQSAVSIVNETISSTLANLDLTAVKGEADYTQQDVGASLESRVVTFGNVDADEATVVGWVIDPMAGSVGPARDKLASAGESVLAIVSVPAWWPSVTLQVEKGWLSPNGSYVPDEYCAAGGCQRMKVFLPNTQQLIEGSLITPDKRIPQVEEVEFEQVAEDEKEVRFLIRGKRLWRNTTVTVGTTKNTSLEVLPNMEGIITRFEFDKIPCNQTLRVWTSEGMDSMDSPESKVSMPSCTKTNVVKASDHLTNP
jgi:hypothetical protein